MPSFDIQHIQTSVYGRYLVRAPRGNGPFPLLIGFHGYGEDAEANLTMMQHIPGVKQWLCCAMQALHLFYARNAKVGASWMTSQDRELRIQENIRYVNAVVSDLKKSYPMSDVLVYFGFSQGTAMACRAALLGQYPPSGVMLLGGDIPPDLNDLNRMSRILIGRGNSDRMYALKKWQQDLSRIEQSQLNVYISTFDAGHKWSDEYGYAAGDFLRKIYLEQ
jgi:predicted esterase